MPFLEPVEGVCEVLGIDPLYLASEGTMVMFVAESQVAKVLEVLHGQPGHEMACEVGRVEPVQSSNAEVYLQGKWGATRRLEAILYECLPRIC